MGAVAVFITVIGWSFFGKVFSVTENATASTAWLKPYAESPLEKTIAVVTDVPAVLNVTEITDVLQSLSPEMQGGFATSLSPELQSGNPMSYTFNYLNLPFVRDSLKRSIL